MDSEISRSENKEEMDVLIGEMEALVRDSEYECALYQEDLEYCKALCWSMAIRVDASILTDEERKEYETDLTRMTDSVATLGAKLETVVLRIAEYRHRIDVARARYEEMRQDASVG
ncbi:MAG TPA: hypothetical protein VMU27_01255 [Candidatus Paceibacterota bacterium]|nr:hypothetical protein [Candidatus Paceibacterota bacterium]